MVRVVKDDGALLYSANERSDTIATFTIANGLLEQAGDPTAWTKPVCILPA